MKWGLKGGFPLMQILGLLGMYFDAAVVFVTNSSLLFRFAMAILWTCCVQKLFLTFRTTFVHNMFFPCSAKRRASDKDLPVPQVPFCDEKSVQLVRVASYDLSEVTSYKIHILGNLVHRCNFLSFPINCRDNFFRYFLSFLLEQRYVR